MKKRWLKKITAVLLSIVMISIPVFAKEAQDKIEISRANLTLEEMQYEHIDYAEVEELMVLLNTIIKEEDEEAFYEWEEDFYALYFKVNTMIQLAQLKYELYMDQEEYFEEYLYSIDLLGKMESTYIERFEEEEDTLSQDMSNYYELSIERVKLVDEYLELEMTTSVVVGDKELTILDLVQDSSISDQDFAKLYDEWYTAYNKAAGEILLNLIKIDNQVAEIQGYATYAESAYESYAREYTPQEIEGFIKDVKEIIPELFAELYEGYSMAADNLMSYNYGGDEELLRVIDKGFISKNEALQGAYGYMLKYRLYDIETRDNKVLGGFTTYFDEWAQPYIVLNYEIPYQEVLTMIHEFGHYYSFYTIGNNAGGLDLDETYSQGLELLAMSYYDDIFGDSKYSRQAEVYTITNKLAAIIQGCLYDEFLQQIYQNPNITVDEMNELYYELAKTYGIRVDKRSWCRVTHNFEMPYYYISYSVSSVAALEIWAESIEKETGLDTYLALVEAGAECSFVESLEKVGLNNPLEKETLNKVTEAVKDYFNIIDNGEQIKVIA